VRGADESGRAIVMVTLGDCEDDVEVIALTVPDAHRLVQMVERSLAHPLAVHG
jgi:hypothetical protein